MQQHRRRFNRLLAPLAAVAAVTGLTVFTAAAPSAAQAQTSAGPVFPAKPVRLVVGYAPGGSTDALARMLGTHLSKRWNQSVVIDNKPGAGGNLGADLVAKADPDGYTLLMFHDGLAANASLYSKLPYDPVRDLVPVSTIARSAIVLGVANNVKANNVKDLVSLINATPGGMTYSSCGVGTAHHIAGEMFKAMAKVNLAHVAYKGCGPALNDTLGGHVPVFFQTLSNVVDHMKAGKIKVLAVAEPKRLPDFPNIPTVEESGLAGFEVGPWYGVFAPRGTPRALVEKISADISATVASPDMQQSLLQGHYRPATTTPEQFTRVVTSDIRRLGAVIKNAGITAD